MATTGERMKKWMIGLVAAGMALGAWGEEGCEDGFCPMPEVAGETFEVVSPVAVSETERAEMAARLDSLDGMTVALVGGSFMAGVTHSEIRRALLEAHPTAKVLMFSEVGAAGPYPAPGVVRREKEEFERRLKELGVDAVVSGNGGCGLCTPKEAGSCIAAERMGIPSVMVAAGGFAEQAKAAARAAGLPTLRVAVYPGAFAADSREVLRKNAREVLWPAVERGLTAAFGEAELAEGAGAESFAGSGVAFAGSYAEVCAAMEESGWTDGMPVAPPTAERVAEFLEFCDLAPDAVVAVIPPGNRAATVRNVAANGVMAGCAPEFMPLLVAFTRAMADGNFRRTLASTHGWTPWCWLSGPVAAQLGFSSGQGEISAAKNAAMGRFVNLAMVNLGGYRVGENRMGTFGYLMPWCVAEDAAGAARAGWRPWHVEKGFAPGDSTLTAATAINWGNNVSPATGDPERILELLARDAVEKSQMAFASGMPLTHRTVLVTESVARNLAGRWGSRGALERALVEEARIPLSERAWANYWANPGSAVESTRRGTLEEHARRVAAEEGAAMTAVPPWLEGLAEGDEIATVPAAAMGRTAFLVTGDSARNKFMTVPGGAFATVKIELPAAWDRLMAERGYEPLASFVPEMPTAAGEERPDYQRERPDYQRRGGGMMPPRGSGMMRRDGAAPDGERWRERGERRGFGGRQRWGGQEGGPVAARRNGDGRE